MFVVLLMILVLCTGSSSSLQRCSQMLLRSNPWFHLIHTCSMSSLAPLNQDYLLTVEECEQFAINNRALAFNFVNPDDLQNESQNTCLVYDCQEQDPLFLEENSMYDYYGIYWDLDPDSNLTCIPGLGMFNLHRDIANFSEATQECEGEGAQLARVVSARRTANLSSLVASLGSQAKLQRAYVGMSDILQEGFFVTVEDEPLNCFDYRGWAPGQPRSRRPTEDCVVLDSRGGWRTVDCSLKLPFLCELIESVPVPCIGTPKKGQSRMCRVDAESHRRRQRQKLQQCQYTTSLGELKDERFQ